MNISTVVKDFNDEEDIIRCISELNEKYAEDPSMIKSINSLLDTMYDDNLFPFTVLQSIHTIFPRIAGESGVRFIVHILRNGLSHREHIDVKLLLELEISVKKYGILFNNAERYINNPLDYSNLQLLFSSENFTSIMRIVRADKQMLELQMDLSSTIRFMSHTIQKVAQIIETRDTPISEQDKNEIMSALYTLFKASGVLDEQEVI